MATENAGQTRNYNNDEILESLESIERTHITQLSILVAVRLTAESDSDRYFWTRQRHMIRPCGHASRLHI